MNPRERYLETLLFGKPDRIPFQPGGPRESTLATWRSQGLPESINWYDHLLKTLDIAPEKTKPMPSLGVTSAMMPEFEEKILDHKNGHYIVQDWKGNICEISDKFDVTYLRTAKDFVTRRWIKCPVENWDDWHRMKTRYEVDTPGRWPDDFKDRCQQLRDRDSTLGICFSGPFWQMREWCGFENLCMLMIEQPDLIEDMRDFWAAFVEKILQRIFDHVALDLVWFSEDMAYKAHSMISPAMIRRYLKPCYDRWGPMIKAAGCPIVDVDSDGFIGKIIPIWIESGVNVCNPIEVAAHNDINEFRRQFGRKMAYHGGVDKRAMAKGGQTIREELSRIEPVIRDGGFIPGCDHGVPSDVSWPNFVDYCRLLAKMTGWL